MTRLKPIILLTRPARQSARFAEQLRGELGAVEVVVSPLFRIEPITRAEISGGFDGVVFTSENAVQFTDAPVGTRAYCVGARTAKAARDAGFEAVSADGTVEDLIRLIKTTATAARLIHVRGEQSRGNLAQRLDNTVDKITYRQVAVPPTREAKDLVNGDHPIIVPLFSPNSAVLFMMLAKAGRPNMTIVAISGAVKRVISDKYEAQIVTAEKPSGDKMLQAICDIFTS